MSEFSRKLKETIKKHNTNVYQISRKTGLDYTTLQKMVNGKRLSGRNYLDRLLKHLQLEEIERQELQLLYEIERMGTDVYKARKEIDKLFHGYTCDMELFTDEQFKETTIENPQIIYGKQQILDCLKKCFYMEFQRLERLDIYFNLNLYQEALFKMILREEHRTGKKACIYQILKLDRKQDALAYNLALLNGMMAFAVKKTKDYQVFYTYKTCGNGKDIQLWSDYLVVGSIVFLMSEKAETALIVPDSEFAKVCMEQLGKVIIYSAPFLTCQLKNNQNNTQLTYSNEFINVFRQESGVLLFQYKNQKDFTGIQIRESGIVTAIIEYCEQFTDLVGKKKT